MSTINRRTNRTESPPPQSTSKNLLGGMSPADIFPNNAQLGEGASPNKDILTDDVPPHDPIVDAALALFDDHAARKDKDKGTQQQQKQRGPTELPLTIPGSEQLSFIVLDACPSKNQVLGWYGPNGLTNNGYEGSICRVFNVASGAESVMQGLDNAPAATPPVYRVVVAARGAGGGFSGDKNDNSAWLGPPCKNTPPAISRLHVPQATQFGFLVSMPSILKLGVFGVSTVAISLRVALPKSEACCRGESSVVALTSNPQVKRVYFDPMPICEPAIEKKLAATGMTQLNGRTIRTWWTSAEQRTPIGFTFPAGSAAHLTTAKHGDRVYEYVELKVCGDLKVEVHF